MTTYLEIIKNACKILEETGFTKDIAKKDVEDILLYICRFDKSKLISIKHEEISDTLQQKFQNAIQQRLKHKPVQYITNNANFYGYHFFVNENCLIPRIDSEIIVEQAVEYVKTMLKKQKQKIAKLKILDVCCGSGCLGLSLVKTLTDNHILSSNQLDLTLLDKSSPAIQVAKINAQKLNINAKFIISDILLNNLGSEKYDIILCNPPYIETDVIKTLDEEVKDYEPKIALDGGKDGLMFYKILAKTLKTNLKPQSKAFFEIGYNQGETVSEIYKNESFKVDIVKDYGKNDRCIILAI